MAKKKKKVLIVHAAMVGGCIRAMAYRTMGAPEDGKPTARVQEIFDEGNRLEEVVIDDLIEEGFDYYDIKKDTLNHSVSALKIGKTENLEVVLVGNPDGEIKNTEGKGYIPVEIKTMNWARFQRVGKTLAAWEDHLKFKYTCQMACYCLLTDSNEILFVIKEKIKTGSNEGKQKIIRVSADELPQLDELKARIDRAMEIAKGVVVLPEKIESCGFCNFQRHCSEDAANKDGEGELTRVVKTDKPFVKSIKKLKKEIEDLDEERAERLERLEKFEQMAAGKYSLELLMTKKERKRSKG